MWFSLCVRVGFFFLRACRTDLHNRGGAVLLIGTTTMRLTVYEALGAIVLVLAAPVYQRNARRSRLSTYPPRSKRQRRLSQFSLSHALLVSCVRMCVLHKRVPKMNARITHISICTVQAMHYTSQNNAGVRVFIIIIIITNISRVCVCLCVCVRYIIMDFIIITIII